MKNFIQPGATVSVPAPANVTAGAGVLVGSLFGVAINDALSGQPVNIDIGGVFTLPKTTGQAWTVGQLLYWSGTAVTNVASTNKIIGCALAAAASGDTVGTVLLNPGVVN
jgi:predicted RecA/RadA family phage recombinase